MKTIQIIFTFFSLSLLCLGCEALNTEVKDIAQLSLDVSPEEIVLSEANSYQEEVVFSWSITNLSDEMISSETHELDISSAVPGSYESTLITILDFNLLPGETVSGEYSNIVNGISMEGDFEYQLNLYELGRQYMTEVARTSHPYSLHWGEDLN